MKPIKLTWERVDAIRALYQPGVVGYKTLAKRYGVSPETIKAIVKNKIWPKEQRKYFKAA
jgi:uncharacterized protein YjcR